MADGALGMGLDALIRSPKKNKKEEKTAKKTKSKEKAVNTNSFTLDEDKINKIREEVDNNPRISLWSTKSAACLKYLKKTTPEFSISNEASMMLEEAIKEKYPEIWVLFEDL